MVDFMVDVTNVANRKSGLYNLVSCLVTLAVTEMV
jgi:hypothetical protein